MTPETQQNPRIHDETRRVLADVPGQLFIGGRWTAGSGSATFDVSDPATGDVLRSVADANPADGVAAMDAAVSAQDEWAMTPPRERSDLLRAVFEQIHRRASGFSLLMALEMGKPRAEARGEVAYGAEYVRWFSEEAVRVDGRYALNPAGAGMRIVSRHPVGPCYLITPWNFPLAMATRKIAPALAAGCTVVVKPASLTPLTTLLLTRVLDDVGVPAGVVNVVTTTSSSGLSEKIIAHPGLRKLSFTGSTAVGRTLLAQAADRVLRTSMELGGNAPFLVFDDADLDRAVDGAMAAKFRNVGQACTAANRFIVHEDVAEEFARRVTERVVALRVGPGTEEGVDIGPLIGEDAVKKDMDLIDDAVRRGARVLTGGGRGCRVRGHSWRPPCCPASPPAARSSKRRSSARSSRSRRSRTTTRPSPARMTPITAS